MNTESPVLDSLPNPPVAVPLRLAAAWTSFMFLYVYVDVLGLYKPGAVADILEGKVFTFQITQAFGVASLAAACIPILMILLSMSLPVRANRTTNLIVAALIVPWMAFNLAGGEWIVYYSLGFAVELGLLLFILRTSWLWPRPSGISTLKS